MEYSFNHMRVNKENRKISFNLSLYKAHDMISYVIIH